MAVSEFLQRFSVIWLAHIGPDDWAMESYLHSRAPWRAALAFRQWRAGFNAGGPHKCIGRYFIHHSFIHLGGSLNILRWFIKKSIQKLMPRILNFEYEYQVVIQRKHM